MSIKTELLTLQGIFNDYVSHINFYKQVLIAEGEENHFKKEKRAAGEKHHLRVH